MAAGEHVEGHAGGPGGGAAHHRTQRQLCCLRDTRIYHGQREGHAAATLLSHGMRVCVSIRLCVSLCAQIPYDFDVWALADFLEEHLEDARDARSQVKPIDTWTADAVSFGRSVYLCQVLKEVGGLRMRYHDEQETDSSSGAVE